MSDININLPSVQFTEDNSTYQNDDDDAKEMYKTLNHDETVEQANNDQSLVIDFGKNEQNQQSSDLMLMAVSENSSSMDSQDEQDFQI